MAKRTSQTGTRKTSMPSTAADNSAVSTQESASATNPVEGMNAPADAGQETSERDSKRNDSMGSEPSEEEIRVRAYRRYLERGGGDGRDFDDWLEAERELKR